jgi:hypothetical protein
MPPAAPTLPVNADATKLRERFAAPAYGAGCLNRCRRLAKDWENLNRKALAFLRLASIRLMLRKLCNPA